MNDDTPVIIARNPAQSVSSVVKLFGFRVRGNSVYVFFAGLLCGILAAIAAYRISIVLAGIALLLPPVTSVMFIRFFIVNRPRDYVHFWLEERLHGARLGKPCRKGKKHASA